MRTSAPLAIGLGLALALGSPPAAWAARGDYVTRSVTEPGARGLAVTGPLSEFRVVPRARVVVPADWRRLKAPAGRLRLLTPGRSCRYRVTFSVSATLAAPGDASARVERELPSPGARRVLDEGRRGASAFRVVRPVAGDAAVRLRGLRSAVLTRRSDIAPAGQVAWSDLLVDAASRPGDECHSGTYRDVLGPQLGDALATARSGLRFVRAAGGGGY